MGNGKMTVNYVASGEASDWMLGEQGIVSMSPELGTNDNFSREFFLGKSSLKKVLQENELWITYLYRYFK
jgi:hypothetical protein